MNKPDSPNKDTLTAADPVGWYLAKAKNEMPLFWDGKIVWLWRNKDGSGEGKTFDTYTNFRLLIEAPVSPEQVAEAFMNPEQPIVIEGKGQAVTEEQVGWYFIDWCGGVRIQHLCTAHCFAKGWRFIKIACPEFPPRPAFTPPPKPATGDERLNAYISAWERQKQRAEAAEARVAELERKFCELREAMERAKRQLCSIDPELRHMQPRIGAAIKLLHEEVKSDLSELQ